MFSTVDEAMFREGVMFDGSSIAGWQPINESDMISDAGLRRRRLWNPFTDQPHLIIFCDIVDPVTKPALCALSRVRLRARRCNI